MYAIYKTSPLTSAIPQPEKMDTQQKQTTKKGKVTFSRFIYIYFFSIINVARGLNQKAQIYQGN